MNIGDKAPEILGLNEKGEEIVAPQYDFSNNLGINFIGEWYLGSIDSNATYYTK